MNHFKELVVIPVIDMHSDDNRAQYFEGTLEHRSDLVRGSYHKTSQFCCQ